MSVYLSRYLSTGLITDRLRFTGHTQSWVSFVSIKNFLCSSYLANKEIIHPSILTSRHFSKFSHWVNTIRERPLSTFLKLSPSLCSLKLYQEIAQYLPHFFSLLLTQCMSTPSSGTICYPILFENALAQPLYTTENKIVCYYKVTSRLWIFFVYWHEEK